MPISVRRAGGMSSTECRSVKHCVILRFYGSAMMDFACKETTVAYFVIAIAVMI